MKSIFKSKTFWWNIISALVAIFALPEFISIIPSAYLPVIGLVSAIGNLILRMITTQGVKL